jgi:hypothetical protein
MSDDPNASTPAPAPVVAAPVSPSPQPQLVTKPYFPGPSLQTLSQNPSGPHFPGPQTVTETLETRAKGEK